MAIPLVYKSCLNIASFDKAVIDFAAYREAVRIQDDEKRIFEVA